MNKPIDPISARQARQGKPVLVILGISLTLAVIAGFVLWGVIAEDAVSKNMETSSLPLQQTTA
jgi:hypothetical protein